MTYIDPEKLVQTANVINKVNREQLAAEKTKAFQARLASEEAHGWYVLTKLHSGQNGLKNGIFYDCEANQGVLREWINQNHHPPIIDADSLETAFHACKKRLSTPTPEPYVRRANTQVTMTVPQMKSMPPEDLVLPYTREQILLWPAKRLKREMEKSPEHVTALNRILAGK